ncbi:Ser/Thr protein phosphatase [Tritrichomonas foetus]|uniref:Serine/threonine-protein phosphatase n=1 Tax=Tritrichomonas foetus TaxID=1144522 RepID=A0A1J4KYB3_9EUKA|nr:Ser/Thr protein phosphatase [Tritrichomonas foetus]|eukprot:OHT14702.1 Ser/Thr protein phosphatase [Tritrichomonas foetus]
MKNYQNEFTHIETFLKKKFNFQRKLFFTSLFKKLWFMSINTADLIIQKYENIYLSPDFNPYKVAKEIPLPKFSKLILKNLILDATVKLMTTPLLIRVTGKCIIVGDLHGNIADLLRILYHNINSDFKFLFLGDYIDRGTFSIEVITLLLALSLKHPERFYLLRGNHEFKEVNEKYGFFDQIEREYNEQNLYNKFNDAFDYLPIAAIINDKTFCVHGGISCDMKYVSQIEELKKPIHDFSIPMISDMMWSDPSDNTNYVGFIESNRGHGKIFGKGAIKRFFDHNPPINRIIRAHQWIPEAVSTLLNNSVITVFSASCYGPHANPSAILKITEEMIEKIVYDPIPQVSRNHIRQTIIESTSPIIFQPFSPRRSSLSPLCFDLKTNDTFRKTLPRTLSAKRRIKKMISAPILEQLKPMSP